MELMTVEEIAARLKLKRSWVYANADRLGAFRLGKYLRFSWSRVLERLERNSGSLSRSSNDPFQEIEFTGCKTNREQNANKIVD